MQKKFKLLLLLVGLLMIGAFVALINQTSSRIAPSTPVFSCLLNNGATLNVTAQDRQLTLQYTIDDNEVLIKGGPDSENITYHHEMWARAEDKQLRFRNDDDSYVIFNRWAAPNFEDSAETNYSGLLTFKGYDQIDLQFCQSPGEFSPDYDFAALPDDGDNVIPDMALSPEVIMDNIDQLDAMEHDDLIPGAYRDEHGCIPSAGYEWSATKQECVRPWLEEAVEEQDDTLHEVGLIKTVEDGIYPMFVVTMAFPKRGFEETFDLNVESVAIDAGALSNAVGKYATFDYTSELKPQLVEMRLDEKPLLGAEISPSLKTVTGILSGAEAVTESDLPGKVTITEDSGKQHDFAYYIPQEMLVANGKNVTAYYWLRTENNIVNITLE